MQLRLLAVAGVLALAVPALALGGSAALRPPAVSPDGHALLPQHAHLAVDRLAARTAADDVADTRAHWGTAEDVTEPPLAVGRVAGRLGVGQAAFWGGGYVASRVVTRQLPTSTACQVTTCWSWPLVTTQAGHRLRVGLDTPSRESSFTVEVLDAAGAVVASATNSNRFNIEALLAAPAPGTWTVRVVPRDAAYARFRLRAKLEAAPVPYARKTLLLPNLQATPPYEFGFVAPANPVNGLYPPDTVNPPLDVLGVHPFSCAYDEIVEAGAKRCLRLTTGPRNAGPGPFELSYTPVDHGMGLLEEGPVEQKLFSSDGTVTRRPAGEFLFHKTHGHYHYQDILDYRLFRVTDRVKGVMVPAGRGTKSGFSPADQLFADWTRFDQVPGTFVEGEPPRATESAFGLSVGWGDVYRWQRPGQYVEFDGNGDGLYVVKAVVDIEDHVLETDETDNVGYALVQITGESVRILERGQGDSPWDERKKVFTDR